MNPTENPVCKCADLVRDYAFDELAPAERQSLERHMAQCSECASVLDQLRLTTAALRVVADREIPRRIVFVSDRVAGVSDRARGWMWAFASACVLTVGLAYSAYHRPPQVREVVRTVDVSRAAIDEAVNQAVEKTHAEDLRLTQAALDAVDEKYARNQRNLIVAMQESMDVLRKQLNLRTSWAMMQSDTPRRGAEQ